MITSELPAVLAASTLPLDLSRSSIFGHSMGGHGALTIYLRSLGGKSPYLSASGFSPIANPTLAPWGEKAFKGYLAGGVEEGKEWDATELLKKVKAGTDVRLLVDVVRFLSTIHFVTISDRSASRDSPTTFTPKSNVRTARPRHRWSVALTALSLQFSRRTSPRSRHLLDSSPCRSTSTKGTTIHTTSSRPSHLRTSSSTPST